MLRGSVDVSFPYLEQLTRESGTNNPIYPFPARSSSPVMHQSQAELRLPASIASATFWRSPYSEAVRQSNTSVSDKHHNARLSAIACISGFESEKEKKEETGGIEREMKGILKLSSECKDSSSDTSSENVRQIRGILCKSSVSTTSRQSGGKVQKRVKFDDSLDDHETKSPWQFPYTSQGASKGNFLQEQQSPQYRVVTPSLSDSRNRTTRMPSLRNDGSRLQVVSQTPSFQQHNFLSTSSQHPQGLRSGLALVRTSSFSEFTLPRAARIEPLRGQATFHVTHNPQPSSISDGGGSSIGSNISTTRLSPSTLEFKVFRRPASMQSSSVSSQQQSQGQQQFQDQQQGRARYFVSKNNGPSKVAQVRLNRSLTSPSISISRPPLRQSVPAVEDNLALVLTTRGTHPYTNNPHKSLGNMDQRTYHNGSSEKARDVENFEELDNFLDDAKTVQILHWLQEVDHKQAREGRCPVFIQNIYREG